MALNTSVMTKAHTKLGGWMARPNMTWSTSAVVTTKPSRKTPSTKPRAAPMMASKAISRKMYSFVSRRVKPRTFKVAISRMRSSMLMFVRLYSTMNASAAADTTNTTTIKSTLRSIVRYVSMTSSL